MIGWVKLHRKLLDWEWYNKSEYVHLFLHILIKANFEDKKWQGVEVKRGQLITSIGHLKTETGISEQTIRTILNKLKSTSELTIESTNRFTLITVEKYSEYQSNEDKLTSELTSELTNNQQTTNKQLTTTKEVKNVNNDNNKELAESVYKKYSSVMRAGVKKKAIENIRKIINHNKFTYEDFKIICNNYYTEIAKMQDDDKEMIKQYSKGCDVFFNFKNEIWKQYYEIREE